MATIVVTVRERIATIDEGVTLVCNNPNDVVQFDFDSEWDAHTLKTARFSWQRNYIDVPFSGDFVHVPDISRTNSVDLGVYADGITSTAVKIPFVYSIKSVGGTVAEPKLDQYDQIIQMINNGSVKGEPGDTPIRGTDYWTESDVVSIKTHCEEMILEGKW